MQLHASSCRFSWGLSVPGRSDFAMQRPDGSACGAGLHEMPGIGTVLAKGVPVNKGFSGLDGVIMSSWGVMLEGSIYVVANNGRFRVAVQVG